MAGFSEEGSQFILNLAFNNTGTSPESIFIGLSPEIINKGDTLENIVEFNDPNYERQLISFTNPIINVENKVEIKNKEYIEFPSCLEDAESPVIYAFITDMQTGTEGLLLSPIPLDQEKKPKSGENLYIEPEQISILLN